MKMIKKILAYLLAAILALPISYAYATHFTYTSAAANLAIVPIASDISGGHLRIYTGTDPGAGNAATGTLLVDWTLPSMGSGNCSGGVLTFPTVTNVNASNTGTAGYFRIVGTAGTYDGDVGTASTTLVLNTTSIVSGGPCSLSGTITEGTGS